MVNGKLIIGKLIKTHEKGNIYNFEISDRKVILKVYWKNSPPRPDVNEVSDIEIEADVIEWENKP
jgi:hypothetical protein